MDYHRRLPLREQVFVMSLMRHGYRYTVRRRFLKRKKRYVIPATHREDAMGIDFWVKLPKSTELIPIQVTQRGTAIFRIWRERSALQLHEFELRSRRRLRQKRELSERGNVAFVLVRDHCGPRTNTALAWGDVKALLHGVARITC